MTLAEGKWKVAPHPLISGHFCVTRAIGADPEFLLSTQGSSRQIQSFNSREEAIQEAARLNPIELPTVRVVQSSGKTYLWDMDDCPIAQVYGETVAEAANTAAQIAMLINTKMNSLRATPQAVELEDMVATDRPKG